ncbi:FMN-dependent NADH-azoreductase [[Mycoplasma] mobile]|uniref:FMN-dependent NADH:quinone oxidoreductase n=1 Tax=Mycoplasma mobile (strain ATCC 43663 / 163K / NCTC 11711) TaxID=267748 RepID=AZOR_MYCM1|nr:FMN-dependent NADH-azoreductase [[Mycoplasma] mobile]Q6KHU1.1 RecName: Full=FMN-dependent NADH:quinone oxidoreductase; AltName: Full=Azo-dye reductase; AltName: Full=FMN-dependent NADH-azo compound oxidoreductase; AltName: Full=FMN-dependent NADH-azoreductase [Mycoplasma mobile 163K]AAT27837.1 acyl carrier protein phosphodiesterase [Mycoplasma mobile 163K]
MKIQKVLVIKSSMTENLPSGSFSSALSDKFMEYYRKENPIDKIIELNLNDQKDLISLSSQNFNTFFTDGVSDKYIDQLKSVDKVVISSPMTNFNYTALLKNYLDRILVANKTFSYKYSKKGEAIGLLPHLKVQILTTQGAPLGWYTWGDHTKNLEGTFEFIGAKVAKSVVMDGLKTPQYSSLKAPEALDLFDKVIKTAAENF